MPTLIMHPDASPFIPVPVVADLQADYQMLALKCLRMPNTVTIFTCERMCSDCSDFLSEVR